jgi:CDGSH-type Zn-finger protein/uncharacterized Fe-S cluster protein YjdI
MSKPLQEYRTEEVEVTFDPRLCIHAAECVRRMPEVFRPAERPWVRPEQGDPEALARTVARCPTGALQLHWLDERAAETPDVEVTVAPVADGPLYVRGDLEIRAPGGRVLRRVTRAALCRCGATRNPPFCDNSHLESGFRAEAASPSGDRGQVTGESGTPVDGPVPVDVTSGGPLLVAGDALVRTPDGQVVARGAGLALCRCGLSADKPFCDGSHAASPPPDPA